jgi:hypothetical protein
MLHQSATSRLTGVSTNRVSSVDPSRGRSTTPPAAEFEGLPKEIFERLPVASLRKEPAPSKADVVRAYAESAAEIEACVEDLTRLREAACLALVEIRGCTDQKRFETTLESTLTAIEAKVTPVSPIRLPPLDAPLVASKTAEGFARFARERCALAAAKVATETVRLLERLTEGQRVKWLGEGLAEIRFKRVVVIQEPTKRTWAAYDDVAGEMVEYRDFFQTTRIALHHHEMINTKKVPLPAKNVARPLWIDELIREIPSWIRGYTTIVTGDMFQGRIVEKDEKTTTVSDATGATWEPDPALLIGEFVIAGWTDLDLDQDRQARWARLDAKLDAAAHALVAPFRASGLALLSLVLTGFLPFFLRFILPFLAARGLHQYLNGWGWMSFVLPLVVGLIGHRAAKAACKKFIPTSAKPSRER